MLVSVVRHQAPAFHKFASKYETYQNLLHNIINSQNHSIGIFSYNYLSNSMDGGHGESHQRSSHIWFCSAISLWFLLQASSRPVISSVFYNKKKFENWNFFFAFWKLKSIVREWEQKESSRRHKYSNKPLAKISILKNRPPSNSHHPPKSKKVNPFPKTKPKKKQTLGAVWSPSF